MDAVIFLHSKGAATRRKIIQILFKQANENDLNSAATLARQVNISKVTMKVHVDRLIESGYIRKINPQGKPVFLELTDKGARTVEKYLLY